MDHKLYLSDPGIIKKNDKYYSRNNNPITNKEIISRLDLIKVPPAWINVWYASNKKCHIQVHGIDASGKKQYILSEEWIANQKSDKYLRMKSFIKKLKLFKKKIGTVPSNITTKESLMVLLFNLLIDTHIRVGNEIYALKNKTYGLTTLLQKHLVLLSDNNYQLSFTGKSKIDHSIDIPPEYSSIIKKLVLSGSRNSNKPLFYYSGGNTVSSEELNDYLKKNMGSKYTCKDFRTYSANILFIKAFLKNSKKSLTLCSVFSTLFL